MIRHLWLAVSIAAAAVFAAPLYDKLPMLLDMFTTGTLKSGYIGLLAANDYVAQAGVVMTGLLIVAVMGFGVQAAVEGVLVASCRSRLRQSVAESAQRGPLTEVRFRDSFAQAPFLADIADAYLRRVGATAPESKSRRAVPEGNLIAWVPAADYFGPAPLVDHRLFWSLFGPLPLLMIGIGMTLTAIVYVRPDNLGAADALSAAAAILALSFAAATLCHLLTRALRHARRIQAVRFSAELDALLALPSPAQQLHDLTQAIRVALSHWDAAAKTAAATDQGAQIQSLLRGTLKTFIHDLESHVTGHAKTIDSALTAAADAAEKMEKSIAETTRVFSKTARTQSQDLTDALQKSIKSIGDFEKRSREELGGELRELAAKLEKIAADIKPMVEEMKASQMTFLDAVQGDVGASKAISAAAQDMNAAATAAKETLEGFVTLARELREASRIPGRPAAGPDPSRDTAHHPAAQSLSEDLRKLQELTAKRSLPKL